MNMTPASTSNATVSQNATACSTGFVRPAARPKIQCEVDLGIGVDTTGSSEAFRTGIPDAAARIMKSVEAKARQVRIWLQSHGDLDEGQNMVLHTDGGSVAQAIDDINKLTYGGGGDPDEHHLDAIEKLLKIVPWIPDQMRARGAIVAFLTADTKPAKSGVTAQALGEQIKNHGILLYLICEPTPTLHELISAADGFMFQISNSPDLSELQQIAAQVSASIAVSVTKGGTLPMSAPTKTH